MVEDDFIIEARIQYFDRFNTHCASKHIILLGFFMFFKCDVYLYSVFPVPLVKGSSFVHHKTAYVVP